MSGTAQCFHRDFSDFVTRITKRHKRQFPWLSFSDLVQEANLGILLASREFKRDKGVSFASYATMRINWRLRNYIDRQQRSSRRLEFESDFPLEDIECPACGIEYPTEGLEVAALHHWLGGLCTRNRLVVMMRFGFLDPHGSGLSLEVIGERFGITKERVRQIVKESLDDAKPKLTYDSSLLLPGSPKKQRVPSKKRTIKKPVVEEPMVEQVPLVHLERKPKKRFSDKECAEVAKRLRSGASEIEVASDLGVSPEKIAWLMTERYYG